MRLGINGWRVNGQRTGVGRYLLSIVSRWTSELVGGRFDAITFYTPKPIDRSEVPIPPNIVVRVLRPAARMLLWENVVLGPRVRDDVIFCPSYSRPLIGRGRMVVATHDAAHCILPGSFPKSVRYFYGPLYRWSAHHARLVITSNDACKRDITREMGVPEAKIRVVPMAPAEDFYYARDELRDAELRRRYFGSDAPYFLFVGKMTGRRSIPVLLEAFAKFKAETSFSHKLLLVGLNPQREELAELLETRGIAEHVCHSGYVTDRELNAIYNAAEALVMPSLYETVSLPIMEAQAAGTPVIGVDTAGIRETTGGRALLLPEFDMASAAAAMRQIASQPEKRRELAMGGLEQARRRSWERTASETLNILADAARMPR